MRRTIAVAAALAFAACARPADPIVARVGDTPIRRSELDLALERKYGPLELDDLISRRIVEAEATKRRVSASREEIEAEVKATVDRIYPGRTPEELARALRKTPEALRDEARLTVLLRKLANLPPFQVSDQEVRDYYEANKARWPNKGFEEVAAQVRAELVYQRENSQLQRYLSQLRQRVKVTQYPKRILSPP